MGILRIERYEQPVTLAEALAAMNTGGRVKALAGGTDLAIQLHEREIDVDTIVDLSRVKKLKEISLKADGLHIGAMSTFTQVEHDALVQQYCPMLAKAASMVGSPQVRNSGTVGGNLANAATAADSVPVMMAMDAQVVVMSEAASRVLPATQIPTGLNKTCLQPNELIVEFILPLKPGVFMDFEKIGRRKALAISRVNMAMVLEFEQDVISSAAIAFGAVGRTAYRAKPIEIFLTGKKLDAALIEQAGRETEQMVIEVLAGRKTTPYKKIIASAVLRRALEAAMRGVQA